MNPDRSPTSDGVARVQIRFEEALSLDGPAREEYLLSLAVSEAGLADRIRSLLTAHESADDRLDRPILTDPSRLAEVLPRMTAGERVGAYEILRRIGAGGMGVVFEAVRADDQYEQRVAIKVLAGHFVTDRAVDRFRRERQILADLRHPNIAGLLDGGMTSGGQPYFVMEFIQAEPITAWCDTRSLSVRARIALFQQVCAAVEHAHQSLVIHRDLKPANIAVGEDGGVKLLDFGIAKLLGEVGEAGRDAATPSADDTRADERALTVDYASPEQLRGLPVGTRSDVYALGVVLYELLTGIRPFELRDRSPAEAERIVTRMAPARPSSVIMEERAALVDERSGTRLRQRLEGDLDAIVLQALRKEPERRYGSARELSEDLDRYLEGHPVSARPDGAIYRLRKFVQRRRVETGAMVLALFSLIGGLAGATMQARAAELERERATEVTAFLRSMLGAADPASFGRDVQVREVLDSAAVRADALAESPALEVEIRQIIGDTYLALGEFELAEGQYRRAIDALTPTTGGAGREFADALRQLSMAMEFQGRYVEADSVLGVATELYERWGYANDAVRVSHLDSRGRVLARLGEMADAIPFFQEAIAIEERRRPVNDSSLANLYANLGVVTSEVGRNAEAETLLVAALASARRAFGDTDPLVAAILSPLASVQARAGASARADSTYLATIEMRRDLLGDQHPDYAWTMFSYADFLHEEGRHAEAARWARDVLMLRGGSLTDAHPAVSGSLAILGRALVGLDSLSVAEPLLREALEIRREVYPPGHFTIASSESILGEYLARAGRYEEAEALLLAAERDLVDSRGEEAPIIRDARDRLVWLYEAWGRPDEAGMWKARLDSASTGANGP